MNDSIRRRGFILTGCFLILIAIGTVIAYFFSINGGISNQPADWGAFGSLVGGAAGSAIAASALLALVYGLIVQHRELDALKKQFYNQSFRDRLNKMKDQYYKSLSSVYVSVSSESGDSRIKQTHIGNQAMSDIINGAFRQFKSENPETESLAELSARIGRVKNYHQELLSHVWGQLIHISNYIDRFSVESERSEEISTLKKQLSMNEKVMILLFVPLFGLQEDLEIIKKLGLLESFPERLLVHMPHSLLEAHGIPPPQKP
ncbi:MAG: hypothetical protein JJU18_02945 [Oceanicaulis sp.]|nr:hypothetical protein [Oceanicaulis sp.]